MCKQYIINPRVGWRYIDSEIVVFNCENQQIVIWNKTASLLWEQMQKGVGFNKLVEFLISEYSIDRKRAQKDIIAFFQEAGSYGLINYSDSGLTTRKLEIQDNLGGENVLLSIEMKAIEKLIPFAITFEATYACNENCIHCYMEHGLPSLSFGQGKRQH